jgi:hypothetical protein
LIRKLQLGAAALVVGLSLLADLVALELRR